MYCSYWKAGCYCNGWESAERIGTNETAGGMNDSDENISPTIASGLSREGKTAVFNGQRMDVLKVS